MAAERTEFPSVPPSKVVSRKHTRLSLVWIIPIVAAAAGAWVAVTRILSEGPEITISFASAEGLDANKTKIRYKGVDLGTINSIRLSEDHLHVIAKAQMAPKTDDFLVLALEFWVVRRLSPVNTLRLIDLRLSLDGERSLPKSKLILGLRSPA